MAAPLQQTSECIRIHPVTGAKYWQGERELSEFEMKYQADWFDGMDTDKVEDWNEFDWSQFDQSRCSDTNSLIAGEVIHLIDRAIERNSMRELHAFIRAFCWEGDDMPLGCAGDIKLACVQYKGEVQEFGRPQATARFIVKMVQGHARSVAAGVNYYNMTVENWIVDGMKKLFGFHGYSDAYHWEAQPGAEGDEIWLTETEEEKKAIITALSNKYVGDQQRQVLRGLRAFRLALAEELTHIGRTRCHIAERAAHVTRAVQAASSPAANTPAAELVFLNQFRASCEADAAAAAAAAAQKKA
jgi:hypothetical protein